MDQNQIHINTPEEIEGMRRVGRKASELLDFITPYVKVGVSTAKLTSSATAFRPRRRF